MTSGRGSAGATPGEVVRQRLRTLRKRRKLSAVQLAEQYEDPAMSATVLMNIEAGRRQTSATVDELIRFAHALDVPPAALLADPGRDVQVAPGVVVDSARFLRWVCGQEPLDGTDAAHYQAVAAESLENVDRAVSQELRSEFLQRAQGAFDSFFADSEEIRRKTRAQVRDVLAQVRDAVASGAATGEVLTTIDAFLNRLE